jgi:DNA-directed RNA polymerase alpha subunit
MSKVNEINFGSIERELQSLGEQEAKILARRRELLDFLQEAVATATSIRSTATDCEPQTISGQNPVLGRSVSELGLKGKPRKIFPDAGILHTIRDVVTCSRAEMLSISGLGETSVDDIENALRELGLTLGMRIIS